MSVDLFAAALWLDLPPARKLVLAALCDRADNATGKCWPGRKEISIRASVSLHTVTEHLRTLEDNGWIKSGSRPGRAGQTTTRWVSVDRILREGEQRRTQYLADTRTASEETEHGSAGEVDAGAGEARPRAGEVASLVTVSEPSHRTVKPRARGQQGKRINLTPFLRSDDSDKERRPDARVERWLVKEMSDHFGAKIVQKHLAHCEEFFVWRKIKQYVDDGESGATLKELMPRAQAEYQTELDQIQPEPESSSDPEHDKQMLEVYRKIKEQQDADAKAEYEAWEREHYPEVANAQRG